MVIRLDLATIFFPLLLLTVQTGWHRVGMTADWWRGHILNREINEFLDWRVHKHDRWVDRCGLLITSTALVRRFLPFMIYSAENTRKDWWAKRSEWWTVLVLSCTSFSFVGLPEVFALYLSICLRPKVVLVIVVLPVRAMSYVETTLYFDWLIDWLI
jgi:hypothetical protein